ncbi:MAG: L-aspartate oxidase [Acidithiobacillus sp.]|uniref:L-aspartate oxidase n=1 Tax=Acidithiobacillus sp. TaxID=1872118 RepID=UPI003D024423
MPSFDFLIIGAGAAGLRTALGLAALGRVAVLSKGEATESASDWAQGGIAAVTDFTRDSIAAHLADTLAAGGGLCHRERVEAIVAAGPAVVEELAHWGVPFDRDADGWQLTREGGHSTRRVLHVADHTGAAITRTLLAQTRRLATVEILTHTTALDLIQDGERCLGAWVLDAQGRLQAFTARAVILASGGAGQVYRYSSSPKGANGDGLAMAWRAGAELANLEFVQFHPTTLYDPGQPAFLLSEALRGEGAKLRLPSGEAFLEGYDARAELAPRDVVARAMAFEMRQRGIDHLYLDIHEQDCARIRRHFPSIYAHCQERGYDLCREAVPVVPAAHYTCGGIVTKPSGETTLPGLYAVGEAAWTGLHGANRLASNSLLECLVTARAVATHLSGMASMPSAPAAAPSRPDILPPIPSEIARERAHALQGLMWDRVGILRRHEALQQAVDQLTQWGEDGALAAAGVSMDAAHTALRNRLQCAWLMARGALARRESRGCHYDADYPDALQPPSDLIQRRGQGQPERRPIVDAGKDASVAKIPTSATSGTAR